MGNVFKLNKNRRDSENWRTNSYLVTNLSLIKDTAGINASKQKGREVFEK